jgi:hypothetical protein
MQSSRPSCVNLRCKLHLRRCTNYTDCSRSGWLARFFTRIGTAKKDPYDPGEGVKIFRAHRLCSPNLLNRTGRVPLLGPASRILRGCTRSPGRASGRSLGAPAPGRSAEALTTVLRAPEGRQKSQEPQGFSRPSGLPEGEVSGTASPGTDVPRLRPDAPIRGLNKAFRTPFQFEMWPSEKARNHPPESIRIP